MLNKLLEYELIEKCSNCKFIDMVACVKNYELDHHCHDSNLRCHKRHHDPLYMCASSCYLLLWELLFTPGWHLSVWSSSTSQRKKHLGWRRTLMRNISVIIIFHIHWICTYRCNYILGSSLSFNIVIVYVYITCIYQLVIWRNTEQKLLLLWII